MVSRQALQASTPRKAVLSAHLNGPDILDSTRNCKYSKKKRKSAGNMAYAEFLFTVGAFLIVWESISILIRASGYKDKGEGKTAAYEGEGDARLAMLPDGTASSAAPISSSRRGRRSPRSLG